jgi:uncharacterized protein YgbK (DUF1537 family)
MDARIAVIADDLTGANDTGLQFAKQGLKTLVLLGEHPVPGRASENAAVVDSRSRALPAPEAYRRAAEAAGLFRGSPYRTLFKKIDSTLRGNIGCEIDAVMDVCGLRTAVVAPAFPKAGRTTAGGRHLLHGVPLEETELARDPCFPMVESRLPVLLAGQTARRVGYLGMESLQAGPGGLREEMNRLIASGCQVIACDACRDGDLAGIAAAAAGLEGEILWVGSAGLAECMPAALGWVAAAGAQRPPETRRDGPVIVMAGSVSSVTAAQIRSLRMRPEVEQVDMDPVALLDPGTADSETDRCLALARQILRTGLDVAVTPGHGEGAVARTGREAAARGLTLQQAAERVAAAMGRLCGRIAGAVPLAGLVMTGGDIAVSCCSALAAAGIEITAEVAPGIPLGLLRGGPYDGLAVVTKAGAFGADDALCRAVERLRG